MDFLILALLIGIALSNGFFHVFEKKIKNVKNPFFVLLNANIVIVIVLLVVVTISHITFAEVISAINFPILILAVSCVAFDLLIFLSYKYGAKVSTLFDIITPIAAISVILIGVFVFKEEFTLLNAVGILISFVGVYLISEIKEDENEE